MSTTSIDLPHMPTIGRWHTIVSILLALLLAMMWLAGYGWGGHACMQGLESSSSSSSSSSGAASSGATEPAKATMDSAKGAADAGGTAARSGAAGGAGTAAATAATAATVAAATADASAKPAATAPAEAAPPAPSTGAADGAAPTAKLYFDLNKSAMPKDDGGLAEVIAYLKAHRDAKAVLSGYHDPSGTAGHNAQLALNRARSVRAAMEQAGIAPTRLVMAKPQETTGTGSDAEARRVEVTVK